MIERGRVFVRAINKAGKWASVDALYLDDESFRRFVLEMLARQGLVTHLRWDHEEGERSPLFERKDE